MDKILRYAIEILFHRTSPELIIKYFLNNENRLPYYLNYNKDYFLRNMMDEYNFLSQDEILNIYNAIENLNIKYDKNNYGVFNTLIEFSKSTLIEKNNKPYVKFDELLRFRETSHKIGRDLFILSFLAKSDNEKKVKRNDFLYKSTIRTDNYRLQNMLEEGLAENHFHIRGSTPSFMLSWICLMNNVKRRKKEFKYINKNKIWLNSDMLFIDMNDDETYYGLVLKASEIRLFLSKLLNKDYNKDELKKEKTELINILKCNDFLIGSEVNKLQNRIDVYKRVYGQMNIPFEKCTLSNDLEHSIRLGRAIFSGQSAIVNQLISGFS